MRMHWLPLVCLIFSLAIHGLFVLVSAPWGPDARFDDRALELLEIVRVPTQPQKSRSNTKRNGIPKTGPMVGNQRGGDVNAEAPRFGDLAIEDLMPSSGLRIQKAPHVDGFEIRSFSEPESYSSNLTSLAFQHERSFLAALYERINSKIIFGRPTRPQSACASCSTNDTHGPFRVCQAQRFSHRNRCRPFRAQSAFVFKSDFGDTRGAKSRGTSDVGWNSLRSVRGVRRLGEISQGQRKKASGHGPFFCLSRRS